ncbi:deoxyribodipyrimidine photolyase-related protein [Halovenus aranensis]|uniref:Deoxyribodipyrimidine photolyase-related protein n=1 Tax=Halovenus aranensis TaxID=890420 RepID=A0A1G8X7F6_9EURY|nr:cryptochrome/photolyase family protein [Halovenus aranensis]SDJ86381.1 deoxyribodipyrimidine photolyase-related protein [Halovenus aranensis]
MRQPTVGTSPTYSLDDDEVPWVLGTQLTEQCGPLARAPEGSRVLLIEAHDFARRMPYHHHKLTLVFAAMRQLRDRLREAGYDVRYIEADSFGDAFTEFFTENPETTLVTMRSPSYGSARRFRDLVEEADGDLRVVENELFVSTREAFEAWAGDDEQFRHESFYRWMRQETGVLMADGDPVGGEWNYDEQNREFPPEGWDAPAVPTPDHDDLTRETADWVADTFDTWGREDEFVWPVTRKQACEQLDHSLTHRLPEFGPYQDAMRSEDWAMSHALLSGALNIGLLHPIEVVEAIEDAYHRREEVGLASAEGCIRQILGWREFMRHVYRRAMPELATANQLDATHSLPDFYWTGDTEMNCLSETVEDVRDHGYSHHIQRLMVLANFATLWGVEPAELNEWFHAAYVDAYHWVTTPNVVEMGQYGHGVFASKPYVSSANYVEEMSDYCEGCVYDPDSDTGEDACPFNALYWDFLDRNEEPLRSNHRMGLMYGHVDNKRDAGSMADLREQVAEMREAAADGDL